MKILPNNEIWQTVTGYHNEKKNTSDAGIFKNMLDNSIEISLKKEGASSPIPMSTVSGIKFYTHPPIDDKPIVDKLEKMIDTLDEYQKQLSDPTYTLKDINSLIRKLEMENKDLETVCNSLPDEHELKDILNQILVTSSMEVVRFNRGDYV